MDGYEKAELRLKKYFRFEIFSSLDLSVIFRSSGLTSIVCRVLPTPKWLLSRHKSDNQKLRVRGQQIELSAVFRTRKIDSFSIALCAWRPPFCDLFLSLSFLLKRSLPGSVLEMRGCIQAVSRQTPVWGALSAGLGPILWSLFRKIFGLITNSIVLFPNTVTSKFQISMQNSFKSFKGQPCCR